MHIVGPIRTEADYRAVLVRIDELLDAAYGSPEDAELDLLSDLVELYEDRHYPIDFPRNPIAAIEFRMDQLELTRRDLVPFMGSRAKVSEVLAGKRAITMSMARALHKNLGIPADILLQESEADFDTRFDDMEPGKFPLKQMAKLGWIPNVPDLADRLRN